MSASAIAARPKANRAAGLMGIDDRVMPCWQINEWYQAIKWRTSTKVDALPRALTPSTWADLWRSLLVSGSCIRTAIIHKNQAIEGASSKKLMRG
jgi:hypothetical protein